MPNKSPEIERVVGKKVPVLVSGEDQKGSGKRAKKSQDIVNTTLNITSGAELPPEAIITLEDGTRVISQKWLVHQPPSQAFIDAGGEVFDRNNPYSPEKGDEDKMQCWFKHRVCFWNGRGGKWLAETYGGRTAGYDEIEKMYGENAGRNNNETMNRMGVAKVGGLRANDGDRVGVGMGIIRSNSGSFFGLKALLFENEDAGYDWILYKDGVVPFVVLNPVSK